jgi:two-component sensor histidine kinase
VTSLTSQNAYLTEMLKQAGLDAEARDVAERIQAVLTDEIHHRMKNMLAMVAAIVRQSMRSATNLADAESAISKRLIAMAKAHDLLLKADLKSTNLRRVIAGAVEQYNAAPGCIDVHGSEIEIVPSAILPLTLILNELCTNATKYGALSLEGGRIGLGWTLDVPPGALVMRWVESGGPTVAPPAIKNLGSRLLEQAIPRQLGGFGLMTFPVTGMEYALTIPLESLRPSEFGK